MSTLGPGARVWVGWTPDHRCAGATDARLRTGTVTEGPVDPFTPYVTRQGGIVSCPERAWLVCLDGELHLRVVAESLLTPIDDGDADVRERDRELADA